MPAERVYAVLWYDISHSGKYTNAPAQHTTYMHEHRVTTCTMCAAHSNKTGTIASLLLEYPPPTCISTLPFSLSSSRS